MRYITRIVIFLTIFTVNKLLANNRSNLDHAIVGIYAIHTETGEVLLDKNSHISLTPASCMKVVTTAAALHVLGEATRFETELEYDGFIDQDNTLRGNLYIRGGGDPCLGSDRISGALSWKEQVDVWADAVRNLGIERIEGKVIGDAGKWEKALAVPSWSWEDLGNYYGAGACALSFHENCYSLIFGPGSDLGERGSILRTEPPLPLLLLENEVTIGPAGSGDRACIYGSEFSPIQFIRGTIPASVEEFAIRGSLPDPAGSAANLLSQQLERNGISLKRQDLTPQNNRVSFHTTYSPTVGEIIHSTNRQSINLYAEHLLKEMGEGSTTSGVQAVTSFWHFQGIDLAGFHMVDGSGLSRKNLITTKQLVEILVKMKKSSFFSLFFESLPEKEGRVRAKEGTMSLVKGCAGYTDNIAFAILVNNCSDDKLMNETIEKVLSYLSSTTKDPLLP